MDHLPKRARKTDPSERYKKVSQLGEGTFGVVYEALDNENLNVKVAVKQIKQGKFEDGVNWTALREIKLLREIQHENVVGLIDVFATQKHVYLVFEYCEVGDLEDIIRDDRPLQPSDVCSYLQMTLKGIQACHDAWVLHRDLKPANLLIHANGSLKIADFGLARLFASPERDMSSQVVTLWYRAPELLFGAKQYGTGVDIWSIGLIFAELIKRVPILPGRSELDQLTKIFHLLGTPTESDWPGLSSLPSYMEFTPKPAVPMEQILPTSTKETRDLLKLMLQLDPNKRPSAQEALQHPFFVGPSAIMPTLPQNLPKVQKKPKVFNDGNE